MTSLYSALEKFCNFSRAGFTTIIFIGKYTAVKKDLENKGEDPMGRLAIVGGVRTAIGGFGGSLKDVPADLLLTICFGEVLKQTGVNPWLISEVVAGNICQPSDSANIARVAALRAGVPNHVPARTVARNCASGIEAITSACQAYAAGDGEIFLVGGTENMSQIPYILKHARFGQRLQHHVLTDGIWEGLTDPIVNKMMGWTAENIAQRWNISRQEQDKFAVNSHQKAFKAKREGKFKSQIAPVVIKTNMVMGEKTMGGEKIFSEDELINPGLNLQTAALQPAIFMNERISEPLNPRARLENGKVILETVVANEGTVTPKNSCPMSDGAAALLLVSESKVIELGLVPMAYVVSYAYAGCDPACMGEGPIYAVPKALAKVGLKTEDIDFFELNEAFASQSIICQRSLKITDEKLNIWGGAIALGHPVGATGACLTVKAMHILKENHKRYAAITMCVGGGQGGCLIIERT